MFPSTFRQIEVFIAAVEAGSLAAAADRLDSSTSSVSNPIRTLERHIGGALFLRRRGGVSSLTEHGRRLYERGVAVLHQIELLNRELSPERPTAPRRMTIAAQRFLAGRYLVNPLASFTKLHADCDILVETGNYEDVIACVAEGKADIAYVMSFGDEVDLPSTIVDREPVGFFAGPDHPLTLRRRIEPAELALHPFVATKREGRFGHMIDQVLASIGIADYPLACRIQDGAMISEVVSQGVGIMCGLTRAFEPPLAAGRLVALDVACPPLSVDIHQILTQRRRPERLAIDFANHLARAGRITDPAPDDPSRRATRTPA